MKTTLLDRIKGLISFDKDAYWWNHYTDEEKALRRMDVWELAKVINGGDLQVARGRGQAAVAHQELDGAHVSTGFEQVRGKGVA